MLRQSLQVFDGTATTRRKEEAMSESNNQPRMVRAPVFFAWWKRLVELTRDDPANAGARNLLDGLYECGLRAGATEPVVEWAEGRTENAFGTMYRGGRPAATFDWVNGEIAFAGGVPDAEVLIAALVKETGIKEHDTDDIPPMVERLQGD
jgi:hypothetical protein